MPFRMYRSKWRKYPDGWRWKGKIRMVIIEMVLMVGIASNSDSDVDSGDIQDDGEIENLSVMVALESLAGAGSQ